MHDLFANDVIRGKFKMALRLIKSVYMDISLSHYKTKQRNSFHYTYNVPHILISWIIRFAKLHRVRWQQFVRLYFLLCNHLNLQKRCKTTIINLQSLTLQDTVSSIKIRVFFSSSYYSTLSLEHLTLHAIMLWHIYDNKACFPNFHAN